MSRMRELGAFELYVPSEEGSFRPRGPRALFGESCRDVAVNEDSVKYLRKGTVDGKPVQMLIDIPVVTAP